MSSGLPQADVWSIAASLATLGSGENWAVMATPDASLQIDGELLENELRNMVDTPVFMEPVRSVNALRDALARCPTGILIVVVTADFCEGDWRHLDAMRSQLQRPGQTTVAVVSRRAVNGMRRYAPNFWSWVCAFAWELVATTELSSSEIETRLVALRANYGLTDAEVERLAQQGELPLEPDMAEWLVLLGKNPLGEIDAGVGNEC